MEGADEATELWRHKLFLKKVSDDYELLKMPD